MKTPHTPVLRASAWILIANLLLGSTGIHGAAADDNSPLSRMPKLDSTDSRSASTADGTRSIDEVRIRDFIRKFNQAKERREALQRASQQTEGFVSAVEPDAEKEFRALLKTRIEAIHGEQWDARYAKDLGDSIAERQNGSRFFAGLAKRVQSSAYGITNLPSQSYNELIAFCLAEYYDKPESRDAIYYLIQNGIVPQVDVHPRTLPQDRTVLYMAQGTMYAWSLIALFSMRGALKTLITNPRQAVEGMKSLGSFLKRTAPEAAEEGGLFAKMFRRGKAELQAESHLVPAASEVKAEADAARSKGARAAAADAQAAAKEAAASAEELGQAATKNPKSKIKEMTREFLTTMGKQLKDHAIDLLKASLVGGTLGAIYGWDENHLQVKANPEEALKVFQAFAIDRLIGQTNDFAKRSDALLAPIHLTDSGELDLKKLQNDLSGWKKVVDGLEAEAVSLRKQVAHFQDTAPEFNSNIRATAVAELATSTNQFAKVYDSLEKMLKPRTEDQRDADFIAQSDRLMRITRKAKASFKAANVENVSLEPVETLLRPREMEIKVIQAMIEKLEKLTPTELNTKLNQSRASHR